MSQLLLFEGATSEQIQDSAQRSRRPQPQRSRAVGTPTTPAPHQASVCTADPPQAEPVSALTEQLDPTEAARIITALHARTGRGFRSALEPLLTNTDRERIAAAESLPYQLALVFDEVVERLTWRWARITEYAPFGRVVEPSVQLRSNLRACSVELLRPSRGLQGQVAFRLERDLRRVSAPIPPPVLHLLHEYREVFQASAFLEPLYARRGQRILRTLADAKREYCQPVDPLVVGWLGAGPPNYDLYFPRDHAGQQAGQRFSTRGVLLFLLGHWD